MKNILLILAALLLSCACLADELVKGADAYVLKGEPFAVWEAESVGNWRAGKTVKDPEASGGLARFCDVMNAGSDLMLYGQYQSLPAGKYVAVYRIRITKSSFPEDIAVSLNASANAGGVNYGASRFRIKDFNEGYTLFPIPFEVLEGHARIEALVRWSQNCDIWVDKVDIYKWEGDLPKRLDNQSPMLETLEPPLYPRNLTYEPPVFPTEDIFPVSKPVARQLFVVDTSGTPVDMNLMLTSLQGLVNREKPRLFLCGDEVEKGWLDWMKQRGDIDSYSYISVESALKRFASCYKGAVITDRRIPASVNAATMYSSVYGGLVCSERMAQRFRLPLLLDMRGMFDDNAQPYYWAWATLWDKLNHHVASCLHWGCSNTRDYLVQHKLFVFWVPGRIDAATTVSDPKGEMAFANFFLSRLPANTPIMGYPWAGVDVGLGEGGGVGLFAKYGHYLVGSTNGNNYSVHSGTRPAVFRQKEPRKLTLDNTKRYVAFTMSDGDNLPVITAGNWPQMWKTEDRGKTPITWTISPSSCVMFPDIMEYYYTTATDNDTFGAAVSGVGYTYPALYGERFTDRKPVFEGFLELTDRYMKKMDLRVLFPMNVTEKEIALISEGIPWLKGQFPDYSRHVARYEDSVFLTSGNMPVLRSGTTWDPDNTEPEYMAQRMAKELLDFPNVKEGEPAFIHAFLWNWGYRPSIVNRITELLPEDYVFVSAEEIAALEKEYLQKQLLTVNVVDETACIEGAVSILKLKAQNTTDKPFDATFALKGAQKAEPVTLTLEPGRITETELPFVASGPVTLVTSFEGQTRERNIRVNLYDKASVPAGLDPDNLELVAHYSADMLKTNNAEVYTTPEGIRYRAAINGESEDGAIIFGPYAAFDPGRYVAVYNLMRLDEKGSAEGVCELDIVPAATRDRVFDKKLYRKDMPLGRKLTIYAPIDWNSDKGLETRVFWQADKDSVRVDGVSIFRIKD